VLRVRFEQPEKRFTHLHAPSVFGISSTYVFQWRHFAEKAEEYREEFSILEPGFFTDQPCRCEIQCGVGEQDYRKRLWLDHSEQLDPDKYHVQNQRWVILEPLSKAHLATEYPRINFLESVTKRPPRVD
jgi:hypothetical protein